MLRSLLPIFVPKKNICDLFLCFSRYYCKHSRKALEYKYVSTDNFLKHFIMKNPQISTSSVELFIRNCESNGLPSEVIPSMLQKCPDLVKVPSNNLRESILGWQQCNFGDELLELFHLNPSVLFLSKKHIERRYLNLSDFFKRNDILKVILNSPLVLSEPLEDTRKKIKYLEDHLKYKKYEIIKFGALDYEYKKIKNRFEIMLRAGVFKIPKIKTLEADRLGNPPLSKILSLNNHDFSNKIVGVSLQEFHVFEELMDSKDDSDSDEEENVYRR